MEKFFESISEGMTFIIKNMLRAITILLKWNPSEVHFKDFVHRTNSVADTDTNSIPSLTNYRIQMT